MNRQAVLNRMTSEMEHIRRRFGVKDLAIFGSTARDEATGQSDLDLLVTFEGRPDFDRFMDLKFHLEDLFGRPIDLVTTHALHNDLRGRIEHEAIHVP